MNERTKERKKERKKKRKKDGARFPAGQTLWSYKTDGRRVLPLPAVLSHPPLGISSAESIVRFRLVFANTIRSTFLPLDVEE